MLSRWLVTVLLTGSVFPERAATGSDTLTIAPTSRAKGHPGTTLTLNCGDGTYAGVVQYWHTPFGDIQNFDFHGNSGPVFMLREGSLAVTNLSSLHSGLYYCLLQHTDGRTLWPYELHVGDKMEAEVNPSEAFRTRRDVGSEKEKLGGVSDVHFAGAVAGSVLLTFILGFTAGALTRTPILRCLASTTNRLRRRRREESPHHDSDITMATLPPVSDNQTFQMEDNNSEACVTTDASNLPTSPPRPPIKPQRSFQHKSEEQQETTVYLERCDNMKEEERGSDIEFESVHWPGDEGGQPEKEEETEAETEKDGEKRQERSSSSDEKEEELQEESVQESNKDGEEREERGSMEEEGKSKDRHEEEGWRDKEKTGEGDAQEEASSDVEKSSEDKDGEMRRKNVAGRQQEREHSSSSPPGVAPRRRVIRLYQYDEEGQRYSHLPHPSADEPGAKPVLKQRSLSLTRLNAIMAAASAGPLDCSSKDTEQEEKEFHVKI